MTKAPLIVDIVTDIVCPWCYVGVKSFLRARDELAGDFDVLPRFRPYELNPGLPAGGVDRHAYYRAKFPDAEKLASAREAIRANARSAGFDFDPSAPAHLPNTVKAHQLIRLAHFSGEQVRTALAVYRAFWDDLQDIGETATLVAIAKEAGIDEGLADAALNSPDDASAVAAEAQSFRDAGVSGVPTFIINERTGFSGGMPPDQLVAAIRRSVALTMETLH